MRNEVSFVACLTSRGSGDAPAGRCGIPLALVALLIVLGLHGPNQARAAADLYMRDTPADTGVEPNPDAGPMWITQDIWVRRNPIPGYSPQPFTANPGWLTSAGPLHENPQYRDPQRSRPHYIYVRVRNRGDTTSSGTERLRLYWSKASTGLSWPTQWVDYIAATCGPDKLYGMEITKPRRNLADTAVPQAEVNRYRDAIVAIGTLSEFQFPDGMSYWHKQQQEHLHVVNFTAPNFAAHGSDGFLPWHREFLNRYEMLLREAYPTVTLFYWDWRTNPSLSARITGAMGSFSGPAGAPFNVLAPPTISRFTGTHPMAPTPTSVLDSTVTGQTTFPGHSSQSESPHNRSHTYSGGSGGNMTSPGTSTQDPFFFLLHGNADRLWSMWQRGNPNRYNPATAYSGTMAEMTLPMAPWNGLRYNGNTATGGNPANSISPWTSAGGYITLKPANDPSVVFPPIYDTAPLTVPPLMPGQSVVLEIPWYPPNPMDFSCFGADRGHVCLLARIETAAGAPFGMTFAEGTNVALNTRNNNNIVWKNVTVENALLGPMMFSSVWLRNLSLENIVTTRLELRLPRGEEALFEFGDVMLELGAELFARWVENGAGGKGFQRGERTALHLVEPEASLENIPLLPDEVHRVEVRILLRRDYPDPQGRAFQIDLVQFGTERAPDELVGGQRFEFDFNKLALIPAGGAWRYWDQEEFPGERWQAPEYDDSKWRSGDADLGYGEGVKETVIESGPPEAPRVTAWFRRGFALEEAEFYRNLWLRLKADDGAVVYLNGTEVYRLRMPNGTVTPETLATEPVEGLAEELYHPVDLSQFLELLRTGENVVAVEVHKAAKEDDDLRFDLELCANIQNKGFPPIAAFLEPPPASLHLLGEPIRMLAEALDPDDQVEMVAFYSGEQLLATVRQPPYLFVWQDPPAGEHHLRVVATDASGLTGDGFATADVRRNLPPLVRVVTPAHLAELSSTDAIRFEVQAEDIGGRIERVEFFHKAHGPSFDEPIIQAGAVTEPPFAVTLDNLEMGNHMVFAVATDNDGATTQSNPHMIHVGAETRAVLTIGYNPPFVLLEWQPMDAILEQAQSVLGPWEPLPNARSPYQVTPEQSGYYRTRLP